MGTPAITNPRFALRERTSREPWWMRPRLRRSFLFALALVPLLTPIVSPQNDGPFIYSFCMAAHVLAGWFCWRAGRLYPLDKIRWQTVTLAQCLHAVSYALAAQRTVVWVNPTGGAWFGDACIAASWVLILPALMGVRSVRGKWVRTLDYALAVATGALMMRAIGSGVDPGNGGARVTVITLVVLVLALAAVLARQTSTKPGIKLFSSVMSAYLVATLATDLFLNIVDIYLIRSPNILLSDLLIALPELWLCDLAVSRKKLPSISGPELEPILVDSFQPSILAIGGVLLALYGFRSHAIIAGVSVVVMMLCYALRTQLFYYRLFTREKQLLLQATQMEKLASCDPLTGIGNRRWFDDEAGSLLLAARSYPCSLVLVDTDKFKDINDAYGHLAGDEVLRVVAGVLAEVNAKVKRGCCARIGGDEFGLLWPGVDRDEALKLGELVRAQLSDRQPSKQFHLTVSVGVATASDNSSLIELLRRADQALYSAKDAGRDAVRCDVSF